MITVSWPSITSIILLVLVIYMIYAEHQAIAKLRIALKQRDALLAALRQWMPELRAHTRASHLTDGFRPRRNRYDDDLGQAVQAIQQATDTKGNP